MRLCGHKFAISHNKVSTAEQEATSSPAESKSASPEATSDDGENPEDADFISKKDPGGLTATNIAPRCISRLEAVHWVLRVLQRSRGCELPGNFNPMLISHLFWEQSEAWNALSLTHIDQVATICRMFVDLVLQHVATPEVHSRLLGLRIERALKDALAAAHAELAKIIKDKSRHPITYNHYYTTTIQRMRQKPHEKAIMRIVEGATVQVQEKTWTAGSGFTSKKYVNPQTLQDAVTKQIEPDMDRFSAEEALNAEMAYYKVFASPNLFMSVANDFDRTS